MARLGRRIAAVLFALCFLERFAAADDWPQYMGPRRDNVWREGGLIDKLPREGLPVRWRAKVAGGYAGPAVADGRVFVADYVTTDNVKVANWDRAKTSGTERILCFDEKTGAEQWRYEYPVTYTISYPAGPRCTPTVDGNRVYTLGAEGRLICFDVATGAALWSRELTQDYQVKAALWGYASHPLVDGDKLICVVGGKGSLAVAFDKLTGAEVWRSQDSLEQGYSPPTMIAAGGVRQLLFASSTKLLSIDPATGKLHWSMPFEATDGAVVMAPLQWRDYLYIGAYKNKNLLLKLSTESPAAEIVWGNKFKHGIAPMHAQPIVDDEAMYGFDDDGRLYAVEIPTGKRLWGTTEPLGKRPVESGAAFIVRQRDRYFMFTENGDLITAALCPQGYEELSRTHVLDPTNNAYGRSVAWSPPAYANGHMYVRNDEECICVDLRRK